MASEAELRALIRGASRSVQAASRAPVATTPAAEPEPQNAWDYAKKYGLSALEGFATVAGAPQAAMFGAIDPESTALEQVTTPAFQRRMAADIARSMGAPNNMLTSGLGFVADVVADPLNLVGIGVLTKAGKAAKAAGALDKLTLAEQGAQGLRAGIGLTNPLPFTSSAAIPLTSAKGSERVLSGLSKAALKVANAPGVKQVGKALGDVGYEARHSLDPKVRMAAKAAIRAIGAEQRGANAELRSLIATTADLEKKYPKASTPAAAVIRSQEPIKKAAVKAEQLREAADVTLDASARTLIKKLASGDVNPADLPPDVLKAAEDMREAQVALSQLTKRAKSRIDETLSSAGYNPDEIAKAAQDAVDWTRFKVSGGIGATPVVNTAATGGKTARAILRGVEEGEDIPDAAFTAGAKGSFDFEPDVFSDELKADVMNRRLGRLYAGQASADPTYVATVKRLEDARERLAKATGAMLRESQIAGTVGVDLSRADARRLLSAMTKRGDLLDEASDVEASAARDYQNMLSRATPEEVALGKEVGERILKGEEQGLVERGLLSADKARGDTYMPNVPRNAREAAQADYEAVRAGTGDPDEMAKALGYQSIDDLRDLAENAPTQVLDTRLARPTSVNLKRQTVDVADAQAKPKRYFTGVIQPAAVSAARSIVARRSYDALANVHDELAKLGLVKYGNAGDATMRTLMEREGLARLGSSKLPVDTVAKVPGYDVFEQAFGKARGLVDENGNAKEIYIPADIAKAVKTVLEPGELGPAIRKVQELQQKFIPWFTYNNLAFTGRNVRSGLLYNVFHLDLPAWSKATAEYAKGRIVSNPFKSGETSAALTDVIREGPAALKNPKYDKLFAETISTPTGPMTYRQVAEEALKNNVAAEGVQGTEFIDDIARAITGESKARAKPLVTPKFWDDYTYNLAQKYEDANRLHGFVGGLIEGKAPAQAAQDVLKWQVDYSKPLTTTNKYIRAVAPFYRWAQTQLPNMVELAATNPGKARATINIPYSFEASMSPYEERQAQRRRQAPYARDRGEIVLPFAKGIGSDKYDYSLFPESPTNELAPFDLLAKPGSQFAARVGEKGIEEVPAAAADAFRVLGKEAFSEVGGRLSPAISALVKTFGNYDLYRQQPVAPRGQKLVKAPPVLASMSDFLRRNIGISLPKRGSYYYIDPQVLAGLETVPTVAKIVNAGGGQRGRPADMDESTTKGLIALTDLVLGVKMRAARTDETKQAARRRESDYRRELRLDRQTTMMAPDAGEEP